MGGNALKEFGIETRRADKYEYFKLTEEVTKVLDANNIANRITRSVRNKSSYGDADILVEHNPYCEGKPDWVWNIKRYFGEDTPVFSNGGVYSFPYKNFQVDFITIEWGNVSICDSYFAFSSGMLMGRILAMFGIKYGHNGLWYKIKYNGNTIKEIKLTSDPKIVFEIGGFDYAKFQEGFESEEEFFLWIMSSKYFTKSLFQFENLDHKNRTRNRKRPDYNRFLQFIDSHLGNEIIVLDESPRNKLLSYFPTIVDAENEAIAEAKKAEELAQKFNGNIVMEITGLTGKDLGDYISFFKKNNFNLNELTAEEIRLAIWKTLPHWKLHEEIKSKNFP